MANGFDGAVDRRLRGLLPGEDIAAMNAGPGLVRDASGVLLSGTGSPFADEPAAPTRISSPGPFQDVPADQMSFGAQQTAALQAGLGSGFDAVQRRLAAQTAAGLGTFVHPTTGAPAQFGTGQFSRSPAMFLANTGQSDNMNDRVRNFAVAVRRRLEELMGQQGSQFASPLPGQDTIVRRGRFGT